MNLEGDTRELVEIQLADGSTMWATVDVPSRTRDVSVRSGVTRISQILGFTEALEWVGANLRSGVGQLKPDRVSAEFGLELAFAKGGLIAALGGISGKTTIKVTLSWGGQDLAAIPPASAADGG